MLKIGIIIVFFVLNGTGIWAQYTLSGFVVDDSTGAVIELAHVFIAHTQNGTVTGADGKFELINVPDGEMELIVSFLGYEPGHFLIQKTRSGVQMMKIRLKPVSSLLTSVEVVRKRSNKRKRYLRQFTKAILGETANAKKCRIINPEVILLSKEKGELKAQATDLIEIENLATGYHLLFLLEYFSKKNGRVSYSGKPFFIPLKSKNPRDLDAWERNRYRAFNGSLRHFLSSLASGNSRDEGFRVYHANLASDGTIEQGDLARLKRLFSPTKETGFFRLHFDNMLKVVYLNEADEIVPNTNASFGEQLKGMGQPAEKDLILQSAREVKSDFSPQVSYLFARKTDILFDRFGYVRQPDLLVEYNYWSYEGLADIVPREFGIHIIPENKEESPPVKKGFLLSDLLIPLDEIRDGGPPKDGIPSIDFPKFTPASEVDFLQENDRIIGVVVGREARAYPIKILDFHEIVNDEIAGESFTVTWCPLCGSGIVFRHFGLKKSFGVSGLLYNSDVLLYDRETNSLWSQIMGMSVAGKSSGTPLSIYPSTMTTWSQWKRIHPTTLVLNQQTGLKRDYEKPAYQSYLQTDQLMFPVRKSNHQLPNKERVLGVKVGNQYKAYPFSVLTKRKSPIRDVFNGQEIFIYFDADKQTAVVGTIDGEPIEYFTLFWFAWYAFHPETVVYK